MFSFGLLGNLKMRLAVHPLNAYSCMLPNIAGMPFPEKPADSSVNNPSPSSCKSEPKELVLVLSNEPDTRFLFKTLLEMWNYSVETAENFEDLIHIAENIHPHLILMDTGLPFVDNMTKMQQIRESDAFRGLPVILLSGHSQPRFRNLAMSLGADDFLVKPVDFDLLQDCLKKNIRKGERKET
jgi:CheY-like chemotaxis protein